MMMMIRPTEASLLIMSIITMSAGFSSMGKEFVVTSPVFYFQEEVREVHAMTFVMVTWSKEPIKVDIRSHWFLFEDLNATMYPFRANPAVYEVDETYNSYEPNAKQMSFRLESSVDFDLTVVVAQGADSLDTFKALPTAYWGRHYIAETPTMNPSVQIISSAERNAIKIKLALFAQHPTSIQFDDEEYNNGDVIRTQLQKWEALSISKCLRFRLMHSTLSGTQIEAVEPVGVISGSCETWGHADRCTDQNNTMDMVAEMLLPTNSFGRLFIIVVAEFRSEPGCIEMYTAGAEAEVTMHTDDTGVPDTYQLGPYDHNEVDLRGNTRVTSTGLIQIIYVMPPGCFDTPETLSGDPSMSVVLPNDLFSTAYVWVTYYYLRDNFAAVVSRVNYTKYLEFDERPLFNSSSLRINKSSVFGEVEYQLSHIAVRKGSHCLLSTESSKFGLYLYGYDYGVSYMHPAGYQSCPHDIVSMKPGDLIDNDCDDLIDEEESDGVDNDGDTKVDEDLRWLLPAGDVMGMWTTWTSWVCMENCSTRVLHRTRSCEGSTSDGRNASCEGPWNEKKREYCLPTILCPWDPSICKKFTWGDDCKHSCVNCAMDCNKYTGACLYCKDGFKNHDQGCNKVCGPLEYGFNCSGDCHVKCGEDCQDRATGECPAHYLHLWPIITLPLVIILLFWFKIRSDRHYKTKVEVRKQTATESTDVSTVEPLSAGLSQHSHGSTGHSLVSKEGKYAAIETQLREMAFEFGTYV